MAFSRRRLKTRWRVERVGHVALTRLPKPPRPGAASLLKMEREVSHVA